MTNIVYVVIHHATFEDGNPVNYNDNMIGCYRIFNDAKDKLLSLNIPDQSLYLSPISISPSDCKETVANEKTFCCKDCKEVYALEYNSEYRGERFSIYEMKIH